MQQGHSKQKNSLFKEKVVVCKENFFGIQTDAVINFCAPSILSGPVFFEMIHKACGAELSNDCSQYMGMAPTSCRKTSAYEAPNFRFVIHTLVPTPLHLNEPLDLRKVYMCVRNSLDMAAEEGAQTIAFPAYFPGIELSLGCEIILRIFIDWLHKSSYSDRIGEIKVICPSDQEYMNFVDAAKNLYAQSNIVSSNNYVPSCMRPKTVVIPSRYLGFNNEKPYSRGRRSRRCMDAPPLDIAPIKLELSAKLAPTILVMDDEHGLKRQYRLTNRSRDNRKLYFRCSRCDTLIKKDGRRIRAKLIVEDGQVVSERYPQHHPDCMPRSHEDVFMQQIDRSSRRDVKDGFLMPQDAYKKAVNRVLEEAAMEPEINGAVEKFPDWPHLRQQYCRIRKAAITKKVREEGYMQMEQEQHNYKIPKYAEEYLEAGMGLDYEDPNAQYGHEEHLSHLTTQQQQQLHHQQQQQQQHLLRQQALIKGEEPAEDEDDTIINVDDDLNLSNTNILSVNASGHVSSNGGIIHHHELISDESLHREQEINIEEGSPTPSNVVLGHLQPQQQPPLQHFMPSLAEGEELEEGEEEVVDMKLEDEVLHTQLNEDDDSDGKQPAETAHLN